MTPGPWYISRFEPISGGKDRVVMGGDCFGVAWLMGRSEAENEANARAISALPDLVEALRAFAEPHFMGDNYVKFSPRLIENARKALSLLSAGGGSSVAGAEVAASSGVKSDKLEGH